jgi:lipoate-protein ligase A
LALEEAIHAAVENGLSPPTWRVWQALRPAIIIGTGQEAAREVDLERARACRVDVLRRHSGGGAVLIGPGCINYSAFYPVPLLPGSETIRGANSAAVRFVLAALAGWGIKAVEAGLSDVALQAADGSLRKLGGVAQARKRRSVAVHGTLLAAPDWPLLEALLPYPSRAPAYRCGRDHRSFLAGLAGGGAQVSPESFAQALLSVLPSGTFLCEEPSEGERERAAILVKEKYAAPAWNLRR